MWPLSRLFGKDDIGKGYADISLVDVVVRKTMALRGGRRLDDILPGEPLLPTLTGVAAAGDKAPLRVIDFGGAAGLHYFVAKEAFPNRSFRWAVIETEQMAEKAAALANDEVQFFTRLENGMSWLGGIDLMHCVGALQYVPEPTETLEALLALKGDVCLLPYTYMGICHAVQGDAGLDPGHGGERPGSAGGLHRRVPLPGARVCVPRELGMLWGYFVFSMVFSAFRWRALQAVWGYCSVYPIVWLHPIRSLSLTFSLSLSVF